MGALAKPLSMALDPLNLTGIQDGPSSGHRRILPEQHTPAQPTVAEPKGFLGSMGLGDSGKGWMLSPFDTHATPQAPPPPPQWGYEPGKGPTWNTPEKVAPGEYEMKANVPGSPGYNGFKGNRF